MKKCRSKYKLQGGVRVVFCLAVFSLVLNLLLIMNKCFNLDWDGYRICLFALIFTQAVFLIPAIVSRLKRSGQAYACEECGKAFESFEIPNFFEGHRICEDCDRKRKAQEAAAEEGA
jgi:hypothetical protein